MGKIIFCSVLFFISSFAIGQSEGQQNENYAIVTETAIFTIGMIGNAEVNDNLTTGIQTPFPDANTPHAIPGVIIATDFDTGGEGVAYQDIDTGNSGLVGPRQNENVDTENKDGGQPNIGWARDGEWQEYTVNVIQSGDYYAVVRVASIRFAPGSFQIDIDGINVTGTVNAITTGGWSNFQEVTINNISLTAGQHILRFNTVVSGFNWSKITFAKVVTLNVISGENAEVNENSIDNIPDATISENQEYTGNTPELSGDVPIGTVTYTLGGIDQTHFDINVVSGVVTMSAKNFETPEDTNNDNIYEIEITATDENDNTAITSWSVGITDVFERAIFTIDMIGNAEADENITLTTETVQTPFPNANTPHAIPGVIIATNYDTGGEGVAYHDTDTGNSGIGPRQNENVDTENNDDKQTNIGSGKGGEWQKYTVNVIQSGDYSAVVRVASVLHTPGSFQIDIDGINVTDTVSALTTGSWYNFQEVTIDTINLTAGQHILRFNTVAGGFDWSKITFTKVSALTVISGGNAEVDENSTYTGNTPRLLGNVPIGTVTYTLGGLDQIHFTIKPATGVVTMSAKNFETPEDTNNDNIYEIEITATDSDNNRATTNWTVNVTDVVEFSIDDISNATTAENILYTGAIPSLSGEARRGTVTYTLEGADQNLFSITPATGVVTMAAKDFENSEDANNNNAYEIGITATDIEGNNATETWTVNVTDVVEFSIDDISNATTAENILYTGAIPSLSGEARRGTVTYTLEGADQNLFSITPATGVVTMAAKDFENSEDANNNNAYEIGITATDIEGNNATETWTVNVTDVVEFSIDDISNATTAENILYTGAIPSLSGEARRGTVTYTLEGADQNLFSITPATGVVTMAAKDFENSEDANNNNAYEIGITATDIEGNNATETWTVNVTDVVEFSIDDISNATTAENILYTGAIPSLSGEARRGTVTYTLEGADQNLFSITPATGVVTMAAKDFENSEDANNNNAYEIGITATDIEGNNATETWTVNVTDVVEFSIDDISNATTAENILYTGAIPSLSGEARRGTVTYTLEGADQNLFSITPATGVVTMAAKDFENSEDANNNNAYEIGITATDIEGNNATETWTVNVTDVVEFSIDDISNATTAENILYTGAIPSLSGEARRGTVTYTLEGADQNLFSITPATGVVTMAAKDFENSEDANNNNAYEIGITATDIEGNNATETWTVNVTDVVEFSIDDISNATTAENILYTGAIPSLSGEARRGTVTYTLEGADQNLFSITPATGVVTMAAKDFENSEDANNNNAYEIGITATDIEGNNATETWTVNVTDVVEFSIDDISNATTAENILYTGAIPSLSGEARRGTVTYTLEGADQNLFSITPATGVVTMAAKDFENSEDANNNNAYEIGITATDIEGNNATETWTVNVTDVVEFSIDDISNATTAENILYTGAIPSLSGEARRGTVTYTLEGADQNLFSITPATGVVTMAAKDFENSEDANNNNAYEIGITATDIEGNNATETWTVNVTDVVEFSIDDISNATTAENILYTGAIPSLSGEARRGTVTYTLEGADQNLFSITPATGVVTMAAKDFENSEDANNNNAYEIGITATDIEGNNATETWTVNVTDVVEFSIDDISNATTAENILYTGAIPSLSGEARRGTVTYTLEGADQNLFSITPATGVVTMAAKDFENSEDANNNNAYEIGITATDIEGNNATETWTVNVTDVVEFSIDDISNATTAENILYTGAIPSLSGEARRGTVTYTLEGADQNLFSITPATGVVTMAAKDFENSEDANNNNAYEIGITATDIEGNNATETWTVNVTDVVEFSIDDISNATTAENILYTGAIPSLSGEARRGTVTYTLEGADQNLFSITPATGVVTMAAKDFENSEDANNNNAYEIGITATDIEGNNATETWTVNVTDVVEFSIDDISNATTAENILYTGAIPSLSGEARRGTVTYTLEGADQNLFSITPATGVVTMAAKDFENSEDANNNNAYEIGITATDIEGNNATETWTVNVTDVVEFSIDDISNATTAENILYTGAIPSLSGEARRGTVTYTLEGADQNLFSITPATGVVTMAAKDFENSEDANNNNAYEIGITATDIEGNNATETWTVNVTDVVEFSIDDISNATTAENILYTGAIPSLSGEARRGTVTYTLEGADQNLFSITPATGVVTMAAKDFENSEDANNNNAYEIGITATDIEGNNATETWTVNVTDVVEFSIDDISNATTAENILYTGAIPSLSGEARRGTVTYTLEGADKDLFSITPATGVVTMAAKDFENSEDANNNNAYEIGITATDIEGNNATETWTVNVTDVVEFSIDDISNATTAENILYTGAIPSLSGEARRGTVTYTLEGADKDLFSITPATGVVTMAAKDFENSEDANNNNAYEIGITATDIEGNNATETWTVNVTDVVEFSIDDISNATTAENILYTGAIPSLSGEARRGTVTYTLEGADQNLFSITPATGVVTMAAKDFENSEDANNNNAYEIGITATDIEGNNATETWTVNVTDVVEFSIDDISNATTAENILYTGAIPSLSGEARRGTVTYTLEGADQNLFSITPATGVVTMAAKDFENSEDANNNNAYEIGITATDIEGNNATETWTVNVTDVVEFSIDDISNATTAENILYTGAIPSLSGEARRGTVTYTLEGADQNLFSITPATGVVTMAAKDFENSEDANNNNAYEIGITATDIEGNNATETWTVNVTDVVEFSIDDISNATTAENILYTGAIPSLSGEARRGTVTYTLEGADQNLFSITPATGVVTMAAKDFENSEDANNNNAYEIGITATDIEGNNATETWTVNVTDVVEFSIDDISNATTAENILYTGAIPSLSGEARRGTVTYTLEGADQNLFSITPATGVVTMAAKDFENSEDANNNNAYEIGITATDIEGNNATETWTVNVTDVVEFSIDDISNATTAENILYTGAIPSLSGEARRGTVTYTLEGADQNLFSITPATGVVTMAAKDFENSEDANNNNAYEIGITATDIEGNNATETWTVNVTDVVEFSIDDISNATTAENILYTGAIPSLSGEARRGTVTYTLEGADKDLFSITPATGVVTMAAKDFENSEDANNNNAYEIGITATDIEGNNATETWTVNVTDVVEFSIDDISNATTAENILYTGAIPSLSGEARRGTVTYTLEGADQNLFSITPATGVVTMAAKDFENSEDANNNNAYEIGITATDIEGNNATETWTVNVTDVVEFSIDDISNATTAENILYTGAIPSLSGEARRGTVTYTLEGADQNLFSITPATGVVTMAAKDFENSEDANNNNAYEIGITATDIEGNNATETWTVNVTDVVEFSIDDISNATTAENILYTGAIPSLSGEARRGTVTYTLEGADQNLFSITPATGVVTMAAKDFENSEDANNNNAYEIGITATDIEGNNATETWTVNVTDVVEFSIDDISNATTAENILYTGAIPSLSGEARRGTVTYTLEGADKDLFSITPATGVVTMAAKDFENSEDANNNNAYEIGITATDIEGNNATETWTVNVTDVVEFSIDDISNATTAENILYTGAIPSLSGEARRGTVTYTLEGADQNLFSITPATGVVTMAAKDFENSEDANNNNAYEIGITATDIEGNNATETWTVNVTDVVEFSIDDISNATTAENILYTGAIPSLSGEARRGTVTYTLEGADQNLFSITPATGVVTMAAKDFENSEDANNNNAYEIGITATDSDGNTATKTWTVNVADVVEFSIDDISNATTAENILYTGAIPSLSGEARRGTVTYTLEGADQNLFSITPATGVVTMAAKDFENSEDANNNNAYEIGITATDIEGNNATETWTVNVTDVVEFSIDDISNATTAENILYTGAIPSLSGEARRGTVTYTLEGADQNLFSITPATGVVTMAAKDFENSEDANNNNAYEIGITATDIEGNNATETWTVNVTDVVEFSIDDISNATTAENILYTGAIPSLSGEARRGTVTYTLEGADQNLFSINQATGVVTMQGKDFETPIDTNTDNIYEIGITATDIEGNTATKTWTVNVADDDTEIANFTIDNIPETETIAENTFYTGATPELSGDDPIGAVIYTISGGADQNLFFINATGVVTMEAKDFETLEDANNNDYEIGITATDRDGNTATKTWTVNVADDDTEIANFTIDNIPETETIAENTFYTGPEPSLLGDDPIGAVIYTISGGADQTYFSIDAETGIVTMQGKNFETPEDANNNNIYLIGITATDSDGNTTTISWSVEITNVVDVPTESKIEVPQVFTPNGDGINDYWVISEIHNYPNNKISIYNVNGQKVFSTTSYKNDWNAEYNSYKLPRGSYLAVIDLGNGRGSFTEWIFINTYH